MPGIGFRAKTDRAIVVAIGDDLSFLLRREVSLVDPALPDTAEPYHAVMTLPWPKAQVAVRPLVLAIVGAPNAKIKAMVKIAGPPWRVDERAAATAAWLALRSVR